jgi:Cys-rich repeat protein
MRFLFFIVLTACSTTQSTTDAAAVDAPADGPPVTCTTSADCPSGQMCFFAVADGCGATSGICAAQNGSCKAGRACLCDGGSDFVLCGPPGHATMPVKSTDLASCTPDAGSD